MKTSVNKLTLSLIAASVLAAPLAFAGDSTITRFLDITRIFGSQKYMFF